MSTRILILSGARIGEQIILETTEFRVGTEPNCEVFFDPRRDVSVRGRSALFRLMDDGWYVFCIGCGELRVNQVVVAGRMRIRSGDVLRMSKDGPVLIFSIVSHAEAAAFGGVVPTADMHAAARMLWPTVVSLQAGASARASAHSG